MVNIYPKYVTRSAIEGLVHKIQLPAPGEYSQDWEYEISDSSRMDEFLYAYENIELTKEEKFGLMIIIISSFDDALREGITEEKWASSIQSHLIHDIHIHKNTIHYWSTWEEEELDNCFAVTSFMREIAYIAGLHFNNNEGMGGFQQGGYTPSAIHPIEANWTRQSRFKVPSSLEVSKRFVGSGRPDFVYGLSSFAVDEQGNALIAVGQGDFDSTNEYGKIFRIYFESETVELLFETTGSLMSPLLIRPASILVATNNARDNQLISLSENGQVNWTTAVDGVPYGRPAVSSEGHIYLCTYEDESQIVGRLYAFDAEGNIRWVYKCPSIFWCDPIISLEGIIYVGQNVNSKLYAFSPDGQVLWEKKLGQGLFHLPPVIDQDGVMYWCLSEQLYAITPDGEVKWRYQPDDGSHVISSPALGADGCLYMHLTGGKIACLTRDGEQLWKAGSRGFAVGQPIIGQCGNIILGSLMDNSINSYSVIDIYSSEGVHLAGIDVKGSIHSVILADDEVIYALSSYWTSKMEPKWELVRLQPKEL